MAEVSLLSNFANPIILNLEIQQTLEVPVTKIADIENSANPDKAAHDDEAPNRDLHCLSFILRILNIIQRSKQLAKFLQT